MVTKKRSKGSKKSTKKAAAKAATPLTRKCAAMESHFRLLERDPGFRAKQASLEQAVALRMRAGFAAKVTTTTIPVVVHVIHNTSAENISDAQIKTQIKVLNRDFQAQNPDRLNTPTPFKGLVANARIKFVLANKDPYGKPTKGITRTKTTRSEFAADDSMKFSASGGQDAWPREKYLNIWVCQLGDGLLGYAQFPGGPPATDGVVILHSAFGTNGTARPPFNLGRTATHEVGHWLNLRHIWGDTPDCSGSDSVDDTPNAAGPNFGTPSFPSVSCNNGPSGDMFMNYMDYVDDEAMFMFTHQQVARMNATLDAERDTF